MRRGDLRRQAKLLETHSHDDLGRQFGQGNTGRLAHEWDGPGCPGIHLQDIYDPILDRILDVHQAHHVQFLCQGPRVPFELFQNVRIQRNGRQDTRTVTAVDPCLLNMFHDPSDDRIPAIRYGIHIDFNGMLQEPVDQYRLTWGDLDGALHVIFQIGLVIHDFHGTPTQDKRGPHHHGISDLLGHLYGLLFVGGNPVVWLTQIQLFEETLEAFPVFGSVYTVRTRAQDMYTRFCQRHRDVQGCLAPELDDDTLRFFLLNDIQNILSGQRLKVEFVRGVIVCAHRLGVAVDHDALNPHLFQGKRGLDAAIVKFNALAYSVGTSAKNDHLPFL